MESIESNKEKNLNFSGKFYKITLEAFINIKIIILNQLYYEKKT